MSKKTDFFRDFRLKSFRVMLPYGNSNEGESLMLRFILTLIVLTGFLSDGDFANRSAGKKPFFSPAASFRSFLAGNVKKKNGYLKPEEKHCFRFSARTGSGLISDGISGEFSFSGSGEKDYSSLPGNCFAVDVPAGSCGARASPSRS